MVDIEEDEVILDEVEIEAKHFTTEIENGKLLIRADHVDVKKLIRHLMSGYQLGKEDFYEMIEEMK
jgi:hypothetical protein